METAILPLTKYALKGIRLSVPLGRERYRGIYLAPGGRESKNIGLAAASGNGSTSAAMLAGAKPLFLQERGSEGKLQINPQDGQHSPHDPLSGNFKHLASAADIIGSGEVEGAKAKCMKLHSPPPGGRSTRAALSAFHNYHLSKFANPLAWQSGRKPGEDHERFVSELAAPR